MHGYMGKFLRVDLSARKSSVEEIDKGLLESFLGGRGLATKLYTDEANAGVDPLAPENPVVLATGPCTGTGAISAASCYAVTRSPLTRGICCAKTRGHFGAELKFAGYDGLILEGAADSPLLLSLMDDKVLFKPALHLWGRTTADADRIFKEELKDEWGPRETYTAMIGPAGELGLPIANLVTEGFLSVGGAGLGAVLGAKNLKGIAVRGQNSVVVADGGRLFQVITTMINKLNGSLFTSEMMPGWGTAFLVERCNEKGMLPVNNFRSAFLKNVRNLGTEAMYAAFKLRSRGCFSCPIACLKKTDLHHPVFQGRGVAPTYMAIGSLGTNLGITDLEAVGRANILCSDMGLDPVAAGGLFATAMELVEDGHVSKEELKLDLEFGNAEGFVRALELVSTKKGYARRIMGDGLALAEEHGSPESFMGTKRMPLASFDPRAIQGLGLHFATSNHGPHHAFAYTFIDELLGVHRSMDPWEVEGKTELVKEYQDMTAFLDSLGFCNWVLFGLKPGNLVPLANAVLGAALKVPDLMEAGERVYNLERLYNLGAGLTAKDDHLPARFTAEPLPDGPAEGQVSRMEEMLPEYYRLRGWSEEGVPTKETLERLGLEG